MPQQTIYQFKITLLGIEPAIWRRIQIPQNYNFEDLHEIIQIAMGWGNAHLYQFRVGKRKETIISGATIDDEMVGSGLMNDWEVDIKDFFAKPGSVALYEYDFGDGWLHEVLLEAVLPKEKGAKYPRCTDGARACPPEDCGGVPGYGHLLEVLASPGHPGREKVLDWLEEDFDPEAFDPKAIGFR